MDLHWLGYVWKASSATLSDGFTLF